MAFQIPEDKNDIESAKAGKWCFCKRADSIHPHRIGAGCPEIPVAFNHMDSSAVVHGRDDSASMIG